MICAICKREFPKSNNLANHITRTHKIPIQQYYDTYIQSNCRCVVCGNPTTFVNLSVGYKKHCSTKCSANDSAVKTKKRQTNLSKYGVPCNLNIEDIKQKAKSSETLSKIKTTNLRRYGVTCALQQDYIREKVKSDEVQSKIDATFKDRYGTSRLNTPSIRHAINIASHTKEAELKRQNTVFNRKGVKFAFHTEASKQKAHSLEAQAKRKATKLAHSTWNRGTIEDNFAEQLDNLHVSYLRNYKSEKYTWKCDFYLPDFDLYIELNFFFTHGTHFYTGSKEDLLQIEKWSLSTSEFCKTAIQNWTVTDILKRDTAIKNNLNYVVLWNQSQVDKFFKSNFMFTGFVDFNSKEEIL